MAVVWNRRGLYAARIVFDDVDVSNWQGDGAEGEGEKGVSAKYERGWEGFAKPSETENEAFLTEMEKLLQPTHRTDYEDGTVVFEWRNRNGVKQGVARLREWMADRLKKLARN